MLSHQKEVPKPKTMDICEYLKYLVLSFFLTPSAVWKICSLTHSHGCCFSVPPSLFPHPYLWKHLLDERCFEVSGCRTQWDTLSMWEAFKRTRDAFTWFLESVGSHCCLGWNVECCSGRGKWVIVCVCVLACVRMCLKGWKDTRDTVSNSLQHLQTLSLCCCDNWLSMPFTLDMWISLRRGKEHLCEMMGNSCFCILQKNYSIYRYLNCIWPNMPTYYHLHSVISNSM